MMRLLFGMVSLALATSSSLVWAEAPRIDSTSPHGVPRGEATELTVQGSNLAEHPRWLAPFLFKIEPSSTGPSAATAWKIKLTVDPKTPLGVYPIRIQTDDGVSNLQLFAVGQTAQVAEKEDNNTLEQAQSFSAPLTIEGTLPGSDVDHFRFSGKKGDRILIDAVCERIGSTVDPAIRLTTIQRSFVASADDSPGLGIDARLTAILPEDGDYAIEFSDTKYQGGGKPFYRLTVGTLPAPEEIFPLGGRRGEAIGFELRGGSLPEGRRLAAGELEPLERGSDRSRLRIDSRAVGLEGPAWEIEPIGLFAVGDAPETRESADEKAPPVRGIAPIVFNGRIDPAGDEDRYLLAVSPGQNLRIKVLAAELGSSLDAQLQITALDGRVLATADDSNRPPLDTGLVATISPDPSLDFSVPAGINEIALTVKDLTRRGGVGFPYRIEIDPNPATFELILNEPELTIPKGGHAVLGAKIVRRGENGAITLKVLDPPPGLTFRTGTIPAGQTAGAMSLTLAKDAHFEALPLRIVGEAANGRVQAALKPIVLNRQGNLPTTVWTQHGLFSAPSKPGPVVLDAPATPVEIVHGLGGSIPLKVARDPGADGSIVISALSPPPGVTVSKATIAEKATEGPAAVNAAMNAPLGLLNLALVGKGKFNNVERQFALPLTTVNVVRPIAIEAPSAIEVKAGQTIEFQGKLIRKAPFSEPVTLKLDALPGGLKAEPTTLAPGTVDFKIKIVADPSAAPATATAQLASAFQINKQNYPMPGTPLTVKVVK